MTPAGPRMAPKLFGIPIRVHPTFFVMAAILGTRPDADLPAALIWIAVVFASVLLHELGHAAAARLLGYRPRIELHAMGGTTLWGGAPVTPGRRFLVSLAGPAAGLAVGAMTWAIWPAGLKGDAPTAVQAILWVNIAWGLLNLLPILPLDGGNVMASIFDGLTGGRGELPARIVSFLLAVGGLIAALVLGSIWAALLAGFFALGNLRGMIADYRRIRDLPLQELLERAGERLSSRDISGARRLVTEVRERARSPETWAAATQLLALACLAAGESGRARKLLDELPSAVVAPAVAIAALLAAGDEGGVVATREALAREGSGQFAGDLARTLLLADLPAEAGALFAGPLGEELDPPVLAELQSALFHSGRYGASARVGERLFERDRGAITAYNVACARSRDGHLEEALAWLDKALEAGLDGSVEFDRDPDLAPLRSLPGYDMLLSRFSGGEAARGPVR